MFYKNLVHELRFKKFVNGNNYKMHGDYLAAIYLVSANDETWKRMADAISGRYIDFTRVKLAEITSYGYLLIKTAQDIYTGTFHLDFQTLCDPYVVSNQSFEMIITAMRIARKGLEYTGIEKKYN